MSLIGQLIMTKQAPKATFKITSCFYVIYGDGTPIYVGYTNRTVRQRFIEHTRDKDFDQYDSVEVKELKEERLTFDFTWDYLTTCANAETVSRGEAELVNKFHTQGTPYQKAIGGGQTWASEKGFVKSNRNNPKFVGMSASGVKRYLTARKREQAWLYDFVGHMKPIEQVWLSSFVQRMKPIEQVWLHNFVEDTEPVEQAWLRHFVSHMSPIERVWLSSFVQNMKPIEQVWLSSFVGSMSPVEQVWLHNFIQNMRLRKGEINNDN